MKRDKPLGYKSYGSIPHLPYSRMGASDHKCEQGQADIALKKKRDRHDLIIVQEKLDGGNVGIAKLNGNIIALGRSGYLAETSPFEQHHYFAKWVQHNRRRFDELLKDGERVCGEWLLQACGTIYNLPHEPFVAFDIMIGQTRLNYHDFLIRILPFGFTIPRLIHIGDSFRLEEALKAIETSGHGAEEGVEGAIWRVERKKKVDFLVKYVRPDKIDGKYLPEISGKPPIWNTDLSIWLPSNPTSPQS